MTINNVGRRRAQGLVAGKAVPLQLLGGCPVWGCTGWPSSPCLTRSLDASHPGKGSPQAEEPCTGSRSEGAAAAAAPAGL